MSKVVITHAVQDIDRWRQGKTERAAAVESGTGSNVTDYVAHDGSNNVAITADVADVEAMKSMLAAPPAEVAARMEAHGVVQPLTVYIES
jgi:4-hydroxyphenylpyruvate dioxygenase-like putative hemolysin